MRKVIVHFFLLFFSFLISVEANGQQWQGAATIDSTIWRNGRVGIGTSSPFEQLHVYNRTDGLLVSSSFPGANIRLSNFRSFRNTSNPLINAPNSLIQVLHNWDLRAFENQFKFEYSMENRDRNSPFSFDRDRNSPFSFDNNGNLNVYGETIRRFRQPTNDTVGTTVRFSNRSIVKDINNNVIRSGIHNWDLSAFENIFSIGYEKDNNKTLSVYPNGKLGIYGKSEGSTFLSDQVFSTAEFPGTKIRLSNFRVVSTPGRQTQFDMYHWELRAFGSTFSVDYFEGEKYINSPIFIDNQARIGIGTSTPKSKLAVNGKITAKEIEININDWPDFVFDKKYQLLSIDDLDKFIKKNNHLPGVPSAKEVTANGINLGEMNATLLQKIEELTLYLIDLKNENAKLADRIKSLEKNK